MGVTKLLLAYGADPNVQFPLYSTPLMAALEGSALERASFTTLPPGAQAHKCSLKRSLEGQPESLYYPTHTMSRSDYALCKQTEEVVYLLIGKGANPDPTPGTLGGTLTLAAFFGSRNIFEILLQHGASLDTAGGYLHSPLSASIQGGHLELAKHILMLSDSQTKNGTEFYALHLASEVTSIRAVKLLLQYGMSPHLKDKKGMTPLHVSISRLASRYPRLPVNDVDPLHEEVIVHLLLDTESQTSITDDIFCAASKIGDEKARTKVLQKMLSRAESHYFPEDAFQSLIEASNFSIHDGGGFIRSFLDNKRIQHITTSMLAVSERLEMITKLLDYDPSYKITAATLKAFPYHSRLNSREVTDLLLKRDKSFMPSNSDIMAVLKESYIPQSQKDTRILETMFSRNSELRVIEDMFIEVQHKEDLRVLLAMNTPSEKLINDVLMVALTKKPRSFELVRMILEYDASVTIPPDLAENLVSRNGIEGLKCVWNHSPTIRISERGILSLIHSQPWDRVREYQTTEAVVDLLRKHRGQWTLTREINNTVDRQFPQQSDHDVRKLYYSLWEGEEDHDLS